jgi:hypothetical protein
MTSLSLSLSHTHTHTLFSHSTEHEGNKMDLFSSGLGEVIFQYFGDATRRSQVGGTRQACNALVSMAEGE